MGIYDTNGNKSKGQLGYVPLNANNSLGVPKSHEILLILKINEKETYKNVDFICKYYYHFNSETVKICINNEEIEFKKYFETKREGLYEIKIEIFVELLDCSHMFNSSNIINIDLSHFRSDMVTNMKDMFSGCNNLINIKFGSFNTKNVATMERMFLVCPNLRTLDLSSFDTSNATNICFLDVWV